MHYQGFREALHGFKIFSLTDIRKNFPSFDSRRLVEWQEKGYIRKVINRWYMFADIPVEEHFLYWTANRIYMPSYISLESALSYYGLIPEAVYTSTSVSTLKTTSFDTHLGAFAYRHVQPAFFYGYRIIEWQGFPIKIAEPEKVILDYLYLNPNLKEDEDWEALRINQGTIQDMVDAEKLQEYLSILNVKALEKRMSNFLNFMELC